MILVAVGTHHLIQMCYPLAGEIGHNQAGIGHVATVDEHGVIAAEDEDTVRLTHVDEVYLQPLQWSRIGGGAYRGRGDIGGSGGGRKGTVAGGKRHQTEGEKPKFQLFHRDTPFVVQPLKMNI